MSCGKTPFPLRKLAFHGNSNRHRVVLNSAPEHITSFKVVLTHSLGKLEVRTLEKMRKSHYLIISAMSLPQVNLMDELKLFLMKLCALARNFRLHDHG